jgi:3-oxoacyl-[acyl-carrier protein] reductase
MLSGQIALVTGASRGIGQAIALTLAQQKATVIGTATTEAGANSITDYLKASNGVGQGMVLNVKEAPMILATIERIKERYGSVSLLVNNAGVTRDTLALRMRDEDWDEVMETNLRAVFLLSRAVLRDMMKARFGRIVNIGSVVGSSGNAGQVNYAASKAGVQGLTKSLAQEMGPRGITVNCVAPGFIDTDMTKGLSEQHQKNLMSQIPLGRLGQVEDVAQAVLYLISSAGQYVTGQTLHVNGGLWMNS